MLGASLPHQPERQNLDKTWVAEVKETLEQYAKANPGEPVPFSFLTTTITTPQIPCHITGTTWATHEIIRAANATPYGLAAYLWTKDLGRAFRIAEQLDYGIVGVNDGLPAVAHAPFGGVKFSGIGREGGPWGLDEYLDVKYVSIALP